MDLCIRDPVRLGQRRNIDTVCPASTYLLVINYFISFAALTCFFLGGHPFLSHFASRACDQASELQSFRYVYLRFLEVVPATETHNGVGVRR
jgi:hypothetical protein